MRSIFRTSLRSFYLLNATQFMGALNDNVFKLLVIYLLIAVKGPDFANVILSLAGAIFVIPFLLFSSAAGVLADRISKKHIIVFSKALELAVMIFGVIAVFLTWELGLYIALFLLATHSAIFGPSKYGIIPELVGEESVSRANGSITSMTYLAMILGTFLASFLTEITGKNFLIIIGFCTIISVIGLLTSLGIAKTEPVRSTKKINPFFFYEIYQSVRMCWDIPNLLPCIFGSSFFLFVAAFSQLNMIPFAMQSLNLDEVGGGYLFLVTAIGIAIGSTLSGRLAKDSVEPGITCIAGGFLSLFFLLLSVFSSSLIAVVSLLILLGVAGGAYVVPCDAFIQVNTPKEKRGQIIAAANFFSFTGVLMAALYLYFVNEKLGLSASKSFALLGVLSLLATILMMGRLSSLFFPFLAKRILKRFRKASFVSDLPESSTVLILQSNSWWDAILLYIHFPFLKIFSPGTSLFRFPWINGLFGSIRRTSIEPSINERKKIAQDMKKCLQKQRPLCLFFYKEGDPNVIDLYHDLLSKENLKFIHLRIKRELIQKKFLGIRYKQKQLSFRTINSV